MLDIALSYARNGWPVFPLHNPQGTGCSCGKDCGKVGKHPRGIAEWQRATCDIDAVAQWWNRWPEANIGLRLDGLSVLDVDPRSGGDDSLEALEKDLPAGEQITLYAQTRQRTGSGGAHYLYRAVEGVKTARGFRPGLDFLTGPNFYIVAESSLHAAGGRYEWIGEPHPLSSTSEDIALTEPPRWLLDAVAGRQKAKARKGDKPHTAERVPIERIVSQALGQLQAGSGRNDAGLWFFCQLRDNGYNRDEAAMHLRAWVSKANDATPGQDRYTLGEAQATLRSAYSREKRDAWEKGGEGDSQADVLLALTEDFEYFRSGPANDAYVRMVIGDHREVWRVDSKSPKVREVLTHRFLASRDRAPGREALNTVIDTVTAKCSMATKADVYVRFARNRKSIYLDLCDEQWRAIEVTADGWRVVENPPVLFRRPSGARALPAPEDGGRLQDLRPLLNCGDDPQWFLMLAWLLGTFLPEGAFVHLVLEGEQGSAKSTTARILQSVLDPSDAGMSAPPKDETDATVSALHAGILAYDNLSGCRADIADVFCRFSTGQGYKTRTFYENLGVTIASVKLPILLNGIDSTVMRGDLLERSIILRLPRITQRRTEQEIWSRFAAIHPQVLGALLDAVSIGLRNLPETVLKDAPRMSDFATFIVASEPALPWEPGQFIEAYKRKLENANRDLAENDQVASALIEYADQYVRKPGSSVLTTAKDLLILLNGITDGVPKDMRHWPQNPESLAHRLVRLAPVLRAQGIEVRRLPRTRSAWSRWEISRPGLQEVLALSDAEDEAA